MKNAVSSAFLEKETILARDLLILYMICTDTEKSHHVISNVYDKMRQIIHIEPMKMPHLQFQVKEEERRPKVSVLTNSSNYLVSKVFIFKEKGQFRLIVFNQGKLLADGTYTTARGARNAFSKFWGFKKEKGDVRPEWTHFYTPEKNWLETWYHCVIKRNFISVLINRISYFIETVFIMTIKDGYRLIVIHRGILLTDEIYKTFEEAKRAFMRKYNHKAWKNGVKPTWSHFSPPNAKWLHENLELIDKNIFSACQL